MSKRLSGKTAVVTGASRGIGHAVARRLARDGATVVLQYGRNRMEAEELASEIRAAGGIALAVQADVTSVASIECFYETLDAGLAEATGTREFDILVNNAGVADYVEFEKTDEATFDRQFDTNVKGLFFMTQKALPRLRDGGRVINLSSVVARTSFPGIPAYSATKGAVNTLTVHLAALLGPRGITVNAVGPGAIDTDMSAWLRSAEGEAQAKSVQALQRVGKPDDIADVVAFLASPDARWVTGTYLEASGGTKL